MAIDTNGLAECQCFGLVRTVLGTTGQFLLRPFGRTVDLLRHEIGSAVSVFGFHNPSEGDRDGGI